MKLLFCAIGSRGDVDPLLSVAVAARQSGAKVRFAATDSHAARILGQGISHVSLGDDDYLRDEAMFASEDSTRRFQEASNFRTLRKQLAALMEAGAEASGLISTMTCTASHLAAEALDLPLIGIAYSTHIMAPGAGGTDPMRWRHALNEARRHVGLREISVPQARLFTAPMAILGLYPACLNLRREGVLRDAIHLGYPTSTAAGAEGIPPDTRRNIIYCHLGSYADPIADGFYRIAERACADLDFELVRSTSSFQMDGRRLDQLSSDFDRNLRCARLFICHGGTGSIAAACRHRTPMVLAPIRFDQLHNAEILASSDLAEIVNKPWSRSAVRRAIQRALSKRDARAAALDAFEQQVGPHIAEKILGAIAKHLDAA